MIELTRCPECQTRYNPERAAAECPHNSTVPPSPLLAAMLASGRPYKIESWQVHTDDTAA